MGGLAGHMSHLHESIELTFDDIADVLKKIANAEITVTEKVDGQNLFITVDKTGSLRAARNLGDLKKGGMSPQEFSDKWKGHPAESAFVGGFEALKIALKSLNNSQLKSIFASGTRYVNLEIMYPGNPNMIVYSGAQIVMHGASDLLPDASGTEKSSESESAFAALVKAVESAEAQVNGEIWRINGPGIIALTKIAQGKSLKLALRKLEKMAEPVGMTATLGDYVAMRLEENLSSRDFPENKIRDVIVAVLDFPGAPKAQEIKSGLSKTHQQIVSELATKTTSAKYIAEVLAPLENIVHIFATDVLRGLKSLFVEDGESEGKRMRKELDQAISFLQSSAETGDETAGKILEKQLQKLEAAGLDDALSTVEGLVFEWPPGSGNLKKITGQFAPLNQLVGRALRSGMRGRNTKAVDETHRSLRLTNYLFEGTEPIANPGDKTIGLVPMSAKPFHNGHWWLIGVAAKENDEVVVFVSLSDRKRPGEISLLGSDMEKIWKDHLEGIMPSNVRIEYGGTPVRKVYSMIGGAATQAVETGVEAPVTYRVYSDKKDTLQNYPEKNKLKYMEPLYSSGRVEFPGESWPDRSASGITTSGTSMRRALQNRDFETFASGMPAPLNDKAAQEIFDILTNKM
jgi:cytidyltransferase-like protein